MVTILIVLAAAGGLLGHFVSRFHGESHINGSYEEFYENCRCC